MRRTRPDERSDEMGKFEHKLVGALVAALVLAGCGADKLPTTPKRSTGGARFQDGAMVPGMGGPALPGMPGPNGQMMGPNGPMMMGPNGQPMGNPEGAALLQAIRNVITQVNGFDAQIRSYTQGHYKQGQKVSELRKSTTEARLIWVKPLKLRAEVIETTNPLLVGAAMATSDGKNVTARARGILGLIPIHMQVTDPKLGNNRNHTLPESNPKAMIERLTSPAAVWTVIGDETVEGTPCKVIQVEGAKRIDREITREVIAIDPQQMTLRRVLMFTGTTKVVDHQLLKFKWNPKVSSSSFEL